MSIDEARSHIASNVNLLRDSLEALSGFSHSTTKGPVREAIHAFTNLLDGFLCDIADIAEAHRPQIQLAEEPEDVLSEKIIQAAFGGPVYRGVQPTPPGKYGKLAERLQSLASAETEGKFFDTVTEELQTILEGLRMAEEADNAVRQTVAMLNAAQDETPAPGKPEPEKEEPSLLTTPRTGTQPFKGPASPVEPPKRAPEPPPNLQCQRPGCLNLIEYFSSAGEYICERHYQEEQQHRDSPADVCPYPGCEAPGEHRSRKYANPVCLEHYAEENTVKN